MSSKKPKIEFRHYAMSEKIYVLPLLGEAWVQEYGVGIDYLHYHNFMEIGYCYNGTGTLTFLKESFNFQDGTFTVIPKLCPHTTDSTPQTKSKWEYLYIDTERFAKEVLHLQRQKLQEFLKDIDSQKIVSDKLETPALANHIMELLNCLRNRAPLYQEKSNAWIALLLFEVVAYHRAKNKTRNGADLPMIEDGNTMYASKAIAYIENHYAEKISVDDIANDCNISQTQLRRIFQKEVNKGILQYINEVRISHACRFLNTTDYSIEEIAFKCGYTSVASFNRNFRQLMNTNASSYRNRPENYNNELKKFQIHNEEGW